ncbi:MAG: hypothetical protein HRU20_23935 [Pseudomonadales bacterium]|nr:hypothetical protein [Pseudomonadales bacterium]
MHKLITYFQRVSHGKTVILLFIITNLIYASMLMYSLPLVSSYAPELVLFDMSPMGYSYIQAIELLTSLGVDGRNAYLSVQLPLDFIYPGMFSVSYALLITWMLKQYLPKDSKLFFIAFVPFLAGGFDYLENISIIAMLVSFPDISENLVSSASVFTIVKSGATTIFFVLLILAFIPIFKRRLGLGQSSKT